MLTTPGISDFILIGPPHATTHALEIKKLVKKPTKEQAIEPARRDVPPAARLAPS